MKDYRRCKRRYYYEVVLGLESKTTFSTWLKGQIGHKCLEMWYKNGEGDVADAMYEVFANYPGLNMQEEEIDKLHELIEGIIHRYIMEYSDFESVWIKEILGVEEEWYLNIDGWTLRGVYDLVFIDCDDNLWLMDHKFTGFPHQDEHLVMDPQISLYFNSANNLFDRPVYGFIINNILSKPAPKKSKYENPCFNRIPIARTDYELDSFMYDTRIQLAEMEESTNTYRATGNHRIFYRTPTKDCSWDCPYYQLCVIDLKNGDVSHVIDMAYKQKEVKKIGRKDMDGKPIR